MFRTMKSVKRQICTVAAVTVFGLVVVSGTADAADILVTSFANGGGSGGPTSGDCECTLREAVNNSNATSGSGDTTGGDCQAGDITGHDTIYVPAGVYQPLNPSVRLDLTQSVTIIGDGMDATILSGGSARINFTAGFFGIIGQGDYELIGMEIGGPGSIGIFVNSTADRMDVTMSAIRVTGRIFAGMILRNRSTSGTTTIKNSEIVGNNALSDAAGIFVSGGETTVTNSLIKDNIGRNHAGGIAIFDPTLAFTLVNSTVTGNTGGLGGGISNRDFSSLTDQVVNIINSTITGNHATRRGGGFYSQTQGGTHANFQNTIIANNTAVTVAQSNCGRLFGVVPNDLGGNFADDAGGSLGELGGCNSFFFPATNFTEISTVDDVDLDHDLLDNGGPTATHALPAGSLAIDAAGACGALHPSLTTDQRFAPRDDGICDSGSFEFDGVVPSRDTDGDGVLDTADNCPFNDNPLQTDSDGNSRGNACDPGATLVCGGPAPCTDNDGDGFGSPGDASCPAGPAEDCNDSDETIFPGAAEICDGEDNDCSGTPDEGFNVGAACTVGIGACANSATLVCTVDGSGTECDAAPGIPAPDDSVCNGIDDNCNGLTDEDFNSMVTSCGLGVCQAVGSTSCVAGTVENSCTPGAPAPEVCNGIDDNCNGETDEGFPDVDGDGLCAALDNCPGKFNPGQSDSDLDGIGDACDQVFLVIDEDSIDNDNPPNFFSDVDVNDDIAEIGVRTQLPFFAANVGNTITLHTGEVGDEGWFALKTVPDSWVGAGPSNNGLHNYFEAGPGLGTPDGEGDREALLDKIPDVTPLRATGLKMLEGLQVCAVVYDSDISINYDPLDGSLKGANLGTVAFEVLSVTQLTGFSSSTLPKVEILILDADAEAVCKSPLELFLAPEPISSSEPPDVVP